MGVVSQEAGESFSAKEEDEEEEELCRICQSPEEPGNPLRYQCLCRGSIKYVHQDCLRTWLDLRPGYNKNCEVCGRSYSFVPVYSENAPERLPCDEFLIEVLSRAGRYAKLIFPWIVVILFNAFSSSLHPLGQVMPRKLLALLCAGLLQSLLIVCFMMIVSILRMQIGDLRFGRFRGGGWFFLADNVFVNGGVLQLLWNSGIIFILCQASLPVIFQWFNFMTLQCHLLKACKSLFFIKDAFVLFFKIGALPCIVGWFLETCVSPMFGTTVFQRYEIFLHGPCMMMAIRWLSGLFCLITAVSYMEHIQKIIHERAFWYLLDVTDPDYKINKLYLRHIFFVFSSHGLLLVILFRLPTKAITLISPSFFPLELWITDDNPSNIVSAYAIYFNLMHVGPQWLIQLTKPTIELIVHKWIITVSTWLQLSDFLLVVPRGENFHHDADDNPWLLLYSVAEGSLVTFYKSQNDEDNLKEQRDNRCRTRIAIMLMLAASSLFLVGTAFLSLPIVVGRVFSASISSISFIVLRVGIKHDDICGFWIGCYILRAIYVSLCFAFDHILTGRSVFLLKYILVRIKIGLLFSIWIFIIPGLLGLLIDLMIIIPLRVPLNETPLYFLIQDWLIGVVLLHIWAFLTMLTPVKCLASKAWRRKFERIRNVGINKLPSMWLLRDVIGSIINTLLTTLSIPYVLVKSLLPLLGFSQSVSAAIERFIWPASLALLVVWFMTKLTLEIIIYLHELIFNERYMVGERVGDLTEDL